MIEEVLVAGFGGQGILLAGKLMAQASMDDGFYATWFPSYGPEMRGGTANCTVVYSDDEIGSPIASQYNTVLVMNQPSLERFQPKVRSGGKLLVNTSLINIEHRKDDIEFIEVPANELAIELGNARVANIVMLGAYNAVREYMQDETLERTIRENFASKNAELVELNIKAFAAGRGVVANIV